MNMQNADEGSYCTWLRQYIQ